MRRKPYSELLAVAHAGSTRFISGKPSLAPQPISRAAARPHPGGQATGKSPLSPEAAQRCRAEIRLLATMIDKHHGATDAEGKTMCLFAHEKLSKARIALESNDGDEAWVELYGAAMLCRTFRIQPEEAERTIARLNSMLG